MLQTDTRNFMEYLKWMEFMKLCPRQKFCVKHFFTCACWRAQLRVQKLLHGVIGSKRACFPGWQICQQVLRALPGDGWARHEAELASSAFTGKHDWVKSVCFRCVLESMSANVAILIFTSEIYEISRPSTLQWYKKDKNISSPLKTFAKHVSTCSWVIKKTKC